MFFVLEYLIGKRNIEHQRRCDASKGEIMNNPATVVGFGINQRGACQRDGTLASYDYSFKTLEEAQKFENDMAACGYGNTLRGIATVTIQDEK